MVAAAVWLVLSAVLLASCSASNHTTFQSSVDSFSDQYRFSTQLGDNYHIFWSFDTATERIDFAVIVGTTGWVGFGLSPNGQMPRSDVVIGWVDDVTGQAYFHVSFQCISTKQPCEHPADNIDNEKTNPV